MARPMDPARRAWDQANRMQIGFFGSIGERLGREMVFDTAGARSVGELRNKLAEAYPAAAESLRSPGLKACIGDEMVDEDHMLDGVERVEFFPPLSGG